jgi:DNA-directed RNA polymerase specialized sigma24 family protein
MKEIKSKYDSSNDDELVSAALKGNKNALNDLIKLHEPFIYNVAWKFTNDENEAKDLTQEVLIKIITKNVFGNLTD